MADLQKGIELMDHPEILKRILFPRRENARDTPNATNHFLKVADDISVSCRFYRARNDGPNILFFHGNGETAPDYDYVAPHYQEHGLNLFVAEYRGYGMSDGYPTCSNVIADTHSIFKGFISFIRNSGLTGSLYVMGRSIGSAPAIEVAYHYQAQLNGLIVESGFAAVKRQLIRLGVAHLFNNVAEPIGFGNDLKIQSIHIPTLIIHGEEDKLIPVEEGRELYSLSGAQDKTAVFVPHAGHNNLMDQALKLYMDSIVRFTRGV